MKRVSIIVPCFNASRFIKQSIDSLLDQEVNKDIEIEIIVVDDGSTDDTLTVLDKYYCRSKLVRIIKKAHSGIISTVTRGFYEAKGDFIALQGADDLSYPNRVQIQVEMLTEASNTILTYSDLTLIDEYGNIISKSFWNEYNITPLRGKPTKELLKNNFVSGGTMMFKRELLDKILPIPTILPYEDHWIAFIASLYYEINFYDKPLVMYRKHANNSNLEVEKRSLSKRVEKKFKWWIQKFLFYREYCKYLLSEKVR